MYMSSKPTTIFSFHHKYYSVSSNKVSDFKTHHNCLFSPQKTKAYVQTVSLTSKPPQSSVFTTNSKARDKKYLCLQNPPQSSVFTTNSVALVQTAYLFSKPTTIDCFHHKTLKHKFKHCLCLQNPPQSCFHHK